MSQQEDIKSLLEAGAHFGHRSSRWDPRMRPFIYTKRGGIHIIDLIQTREHMDRAAGFARQVAADGKQILFVGTKKHIAPVVEEAAREASMPYVTERWFGGILTNFQTIHTRIKYFKKLSQQLESGELADTYNKREIAKFTEERDKMATSFTGLSDMEELPGALFVSDVVNEYTAIREANRLGIPIIAIVDTNGNPTPIDYPIPANDDAVKTVSLIARKIGSAIDAGVEDHTAATAKAATSKKATQQSSPTSESSPKRSEETTETNGQDVAGAASAGEVTNKEET